MTEDGKTVPLDWADQSVLVTGGGGFLGSFVVEALRRRGARDLFVPRHADYDLTQIEPIKQVLADSRPTIVVHLAAKAGGIGANRSRPAEFFYDNLIMGVQLMHQAWRTGVDKFVSIGTVCSYPKFTPVPFQEDAIWEGYPEETNAPYGLAKKMLIVQSQAYRAQYGFNAINLIPVNLYGPGDNFDLETSHVVPALIRKCLEARAEGRESIVLWGDGSPTREFLFAPDAAEGIAMGAERLNTSDPVNLGSGQEISILALAEMIQELTGFDGQIEWDRSKPNGQPRRMLDTSRARDLFGFEAETSLEAGIRQTIEWYQRQPAGVGSGG